MTDLKALMGLAEKATKRPWKTDGDAIVETDWDGVHERPVSFDEEYDPDICEVLTGENRKNDAAYICAAANTVPDLIQRLQAAESCLRAIICEINDRTICDSERWCNIEERAKEALTPPTKSEENR